MRLTTPDENDLLTALHDGAFDEPLWSTFLNRLRGRVRADSAVILFRSCEGQAADITQLRSGRPAPDDVDRRYVEDLYRLDPVPYHQLKANRVYALNEFLNPDNPDHTRFKSEFIDPSGMRYGRILRVEEPGGAEAWCVISRQDQDFQASDTALLAALAPHLRISLRNFMAIEREKVRADISSDMVERLNFGWVTLDARGHVIDLDGHAQRLFRRSETLRRTRQGRLILALPPADRALSELLRHARAGGSIRPQLIHVCDEPWLDLLALPVTVDTTPQRGRPLLTLYIQGDQQRSNERCEQLMAFFDLSLNEAHLALALSRGRTIAEAASELGLTLESARTYTKRIYAKTSTNGQSALIRLILASVIALA